MTTSYVYASKKNQWTPKYQEKQKQKSIFKELGLKKIKSKNKTILNSKQVTNKKAPAIKPENALEALYLQGPKSKTHLAKLKEESLKQKQKAVPTLIKVMKSKAYPSENRWVATYMLGRIMGKKSAPYISKFTRHPNWMLRLASLKVLLHLDQRQYKGIYARLLEDDSLIVRHQALQNIKIMKLKDLAPYVWKMLYNKKNYVGTKGKRKRNNIIKDAIRVVGDLKFHKAKKAMLEMFKKKKYSDVYNELDYSLSQLDGPSPKGSISVKKNYWNKKSIKETTIL